MFKVTNGNDFDFVAMHAGRSYSFPRGRTVALPADAAAHIFGLGDPNKSTVLSRHGWALPLESSARGLAILNKFAFEKIEPKLDVPMASDIHGSAPVVSDPAADDGTDGPKSVAGDLGMTIPRATTANYKATQRSAA